MPFADRADAGRRLGDALAHLADESPVVLGLPRGGVPVAAEVARRLGAPLDVLVVRKVGAPANPEYGVGAVGEGGATVVNESALRMLGLTNADIERLARPERDEVEQRLHRYREGRQGVSVAGRTVIVVDDGLATGVTAAVAIDVLRRRDPGRIVLAVPVGAPDTAARLEALADEVVCLERPLGFAAVGTFYREFGQVSDETVARILIGEAVVHAGEVELELGTAVLPGVLGLPSGARGLVVFAHGSGSSHTSPRNQLVADGLHEAGLATLRFDLLTPVEGADRANAFDIPLLAQRLVGATRWVRSRSDLSALPLGYFGASTGGAAALLAAADDARVHAVVARGGRPDLVESYLAQVRAPTLFIVGELDPEVLEHNRRVAEKLITPHQLAVVGGATHLFEERGALEQVVSLATAWFQRHLIEAENGQGSDLGG